jgi:uroporphyrinogen-III decarboxylase
MKFEQSIESLMKSYEKKYAARESRIHASLRRVTDALHRRPVDRVPVIQMSGTILYPRHEIFHSREKNLASQLANILLTLEHDTDYVPYLDPFEGVTILSEAFGCKVEVPENGDPWIREPLIGEDPRDVYSLKKPSKDGAVYRRVLETLDYFQRETGSAIPVGATDPQGPLDAASLIWDNTSFLLACALHKKEVHHLLSLVTDAFIEFYSMQYELLKNPAYPVHSFPLVDSADGISVSDDEAIMLSPGLYEEFGVPYLNRISRAFGGLYYHSCGDFGHLVDLICSIDGIRAVNGHVSPKEMNQRITARVAARGVGLFAGMSDREIGWEDPDWSMEQITKVYDAYYIPAVIGATGGRGVVLVGYGGYQGYLDLKDRDSADRGEGTGALVGTGGHAVVKNPLVNVPVEKKNTNFHSILAAVDTAVRRREAV